jgi:hypothetical protein
MLSKFIQHWSWLGAVLGGLTYLVLNVLLEIYFPDHWAGSPSRVLDFSYADYSRLLWIPALLLLFGFTGIYNYVSKSVGRLGKLGFLIAVAGFGLDILGNLIEFWLFGFLLVPFLGEFRTGSDGSQFGYEVSGYGTMFLMVGLLLFGIACLRSTLPVRWRLLPFAIGVIYVTVLFFFFAELIIIHAIIFGLSWILLGYFLWKDKFIELTISTS